MSHHMPPDLEATLRKLEALHQQIGQEIAALRLLQEQCGLGVFHGTIDPPAPYALSVPTVDLSDLPDVEARRQAVADDLRKKSRQHADIDGLELADLLGVTPGEAGDRIHLCAIDEDATDEWLREELSQGEGDGSVLLEEVLSATRSKALRRYLHKFEEGEEVDEFPVTPRELKKLAPLYARKRLEDGEIDKAWSYDDVVAPDGTKLIFTFDIGEDGEVEGCLATPYDGRLEPNPKEYAWE